MLPFWSGIFAAGLWAIWGGATGRGALQISRTPLKFTSWFSKFGICWCRSTLSESSFMKQQQYGAKVSKEASKTVQVHMEGQWKHARQGCDGSWWNKRVYRDLASASADSLLCGPLHGYQEEHFLRSAYPCGPKPGSQTTSEINVQNDITLTGGIANLGKSQRWPRVFTNSIKFHKPMSVPYMFGIAVFFCGSS